ncbi:hypothetical protein [Bacillus cereus]|uniref:hypothetical protein n=1 Tax=Bacillus cereus TaxID=1396 RepID=UPI0018792EF9|nr:hypothetical protein [Bacillus cereus]MBE7122202.1 hypothetical protein [Bacillus cereus]
MIQKNYDANLFDLESTECRFIERLCCEFNHDFSDFLVLEIESNYLIEVVMDEFHNVFVINITLQEDKMEYWKCTFEPITRKDVIETIEKEFLLPKSPLLQRNLLQRSSEFRKEVMEFLLKVKAFK